MLDAVQKLAEHEINITSLIIDDNWQSIDYEGESPFQHAWLEFEAERKAFPSGLKGLVSQIRQRCPNIQHIAVWHALLGYWGGISPRGKIAQTYKTVETVCEDSRRRNLPLGGTRTVVAEAAVEKFYDDFYRFLTEAGIDGVKTDAQFVIDTWVSALVRRGLINKYLDAWSSASSRYFGVKVISCMSQMPQAIFRSRMRQNRPPLVVRNSDDFFPEIPASHPWHVWTNAHNSILTQFLNVLPDWDMFQTVHDYSRFHAAARCVSGGPIYVTDVPGEHDMGLIGQMTGVAPKGETIIFRPSAVGRSIHGYVGYDDDLLLKVGSRHGKSALQTAFEQVLMGLNSNFGLRHGDIGHFQHLCASADGDDTPCVLSRNDLVCRLCDSRPHIWQSSEAYESREAGFTLDIVSRHTGFRDTLRFPIDSFQW